MKTLARLFNLLDEVGLAFWSFVARLLLGMAIW